MIYVRHSPFTATTIPHLDQSPGRLDPYRKTSTFTKKQEELLHPNFIEFSPDCKKYDLVYIVKESESNADLKYSLRSICKFCEFNKVWIVGYKPKWIKDVEYIPTKQSGNKWENSMVNYAAACNCPEISDDFVLMNDDFFAIRQIIDWKVSTNKCLGTIDEKIQMLKSRRMLSRWQSAFTFAKELLQKLECKNQYNYETHLPIIINKANFKEMLDMPVIKEFMQTDKVLHKRSVYKNLFQDPNIIPNKITDVKIELQKDLDSLALTEDWISVYDYVVDNIRRYPKINKLLRSLFADKCRFEV